MKGKRKKEETANEKEKIKKEAKWKSKGRRDGQCKNKETKKGRKGRHKRKLNSSQQAHHGASIHGVGAGSFSHKAKDWCCTGGYAMVRPDRVVVLMNYSPGCAICLFQSKCANCVIGQLDRFRELDLNVTVRLSFFRWPVLMAFHTTALLNIGHLEQRQSALRTNNSQPNRTEQGWMRKLSKSTHTSILLLPVSMTQFERKSPIQGKAGGLSIKPWFQFNRTSNRNRSNCNVGLKKKKTTRPIFPLRPVSFNTAIASMESSLWWW